MRGVRGASSLREDRACGPSDLSRYASQPEALVPLRGAAPLTIDLCCGLGGWTDGLLSEGWRVRGYDIEAHEYGEDRYPAELVLRNVLEMHGSEIADADLIVASPPCQEYSYMAMPWSRAKQIARALRGGGEFPDPYRGSRTVADLNAIFDACFRLQREASEAAGRYIPMVVENVRGAEPWVGRAAWNYGSFYLWGDLPALMPHTANAVKVPSFRFDGSGRSFQSESVRRTDVGNKRQHLSSARKAASALIAKIPLALSSHIARVYKPERLAA